MLTNLKKMRKEKGMTQELVASMLGVPLSTYRTWEQQQNTPRATELVKLCSFFECSLDDLFGEDAKNTDYKNIMGRVAHPVAVPSYAPYKGRISAGDPIFINELHEEQRWVDPSVIEDHPNGYFLYVDGDSMNLVVPDGCFVLIDPDAELCTGDIAAIRTDGDEARLKRIHITANAITLIPESTNPKHETTTIPFSDEMQRVQRIGKVVWYYYNPLDRG